MATNPARIFTRIEVANTWTEIANFGTNAAFVRGSFHNRAVEPARISLAIINTVDVPADSVDLPAALDALEIASQSEVKPFEGMAIGAEVPVLMVVGDLLYMKSDQVLTHVSIFATLEGG